MFCGLAHPARTLIVIGVGMAALTGCLAVTDRQLTVPVEPAADVAQRQQEQQTRQREQDRQKQRRARIEKLLEEADTAHGDNRLTLPIHDNAYDRYAAVLLLDPGNAEAKSGLQSLLLSYVELVRSALRDRHVDRARQLLEQVREYYPPHSLLKDLEQDIEQAQEQLRMQLVRLTEQDLEGETFQLPAAELSRKGPAVRRFLAKVAERVRETDESVLIVARTDAEGRWIYQQMKDTVPEYRIRGDIRLAATPELRLLPPL